MNFNTPATEAAKLNILKLKEYSIHFERRYFLSWIFVVSDIFKEKTKIFSYNYRDLGMPRHLIYVAKSANALLSSLQIECS